MNESWSETLAPALVQLVALGEDANITRVAQTTGVSQPTLSRAIQRWEEKLGIEILVPDGRGIRFTDEGRDLVAAASETLATLERALSRMRETSAKIPLRVGFLRSLGPAVAGELIASFLLTHSEVVISHREGSSAELLEAIDSGSLDTAIIAPEPHPPFSWLAFGEQALVLVVPSQHRLAASPAVSLREAQDEPFLALDRRFDSRSRGDALCAAAGFIPRIVLEADDLLTIRGYVATGMGVAILPADASLSPRTVNIPLADAGACRTFGLVWDSTRTSSTTQALVAHTSELTEKYPGWADILE